MKKLLQYINFPFQATSKLNIPQINSYLSLLLNSCIFTTYYFRKTLMIKHISYLALLICITAINIKAACPTTVTTGLSQTTGSFCESGFDLTLFAANLVADVDKAEYNLIWQTDAGAAVPDPSNVIPPPSPILGDIFDIKYNLFLECVEDPSNIISGGSFTATIFPSSSLLNCTDETTSNDCDPIIPISSQCNVGLQVEYESAQGSGIWSSTPPTFTPGTSGNIVSYRVYYPGGLDVGCAAIGLKTVNCPLPCEPSDCANLILNPFVINGVFLDENFDYPALSFCDGNTFNIDQNRYGEWDTNPGIDTINYDMPNCGKAVWYQNGTEVDPNITFTHDNTDCEPIVLNYSLEIECVADPIFFEPAGNFEATVFPDLTNFFKRPADRCSRQLDITCTSVNIIVEYSTDGQNYDAATLLPPLTAADPPQTIYYKVTYDGFTPSTNCPNLDSSFTADCNATCPTDITPTNQPIPSICGETGSVTNISSTLSSISANPDAIFVLTDANGDPVDLQNGDQMILDYKGNGCDVDEQTISISVGCSTDSNFSEDGGTFTITVYPPIDATLFNLPTDCNPEITLNCPPGAPNDLIVEYSINGAFSTTTPPTTLNQNDLLTYTITSQGNNVNFGGCFLEGTYTCNDACQNAGVGSTETLCNSDSQIYSLDQFLTDSDPFGSWSEISAVPSSGVFDPPTGRFSPSGQIPGTYVFNYAFAANINTDCPLSETTVTINIEESVEAEITPDATVCNDGGDPTSLDLNDLVINSEIPGTWLAPDNSIIPDGSTTIDFTGLESDNYIFTYNIVRDPSPCGTINLEANIVARECLGKIAIPTAFSPTGQNSTLYILNTAGVADLEFNIYNRWGQRVYQSTDYNLGWDGTFNRVEQEVGVYVYYVKVNYLNGESEIVQGNVVLIR